MKIAFVYDRVNKWGGAERVLLALHEIWPEAPLYTAVYDPDGAPWAKVFDVRWSFLQHFPFAKSHHEFYPWLTPLAFQSFNFDDYDVVLSVTSAEAKNLITKPHTLHVCYCLTPTRYLWSGYKAYQMYPSGSIIEKISQKTLARFAPTLRSWDMYASTRPDHYIAISDHVGDRIHKYYHRRVEKTIYPPVDTDFFVPDNHQKNNRPSYYLLVSRLVSYKRIDMIIDAFNELGWPLVVIGDGWAKQKLIAQSNRNIRFIGGYLTDRELLQYYQGCRAFVFSGDEDFGIVAAEAQSCGKPVIAYKESGIGEIVKNGKTGELFTKQSADGIKEALIASEEKEYNPFACRTNAIRFSKIRFKEEVKQTISDLWQSYL